MTLTTSSAIVPIVTGLAVVPSAGTLTFAVPHEDALEFYSNCYSDKVRTEVNRWLRILARVAAAGDAKGMRVRAMQAEARIADVSFGSVRAKWYAYDQSGGDWRTLVKRSLKGSGRQWTARCNLPDEFISHLGRIAGNNRRCFASAYVQLVKQWRNWRRHGLPEHAIPGYRTAPEPDDRGRYPHGWSKRNLYRLLPKRAELTLARIGTTAAREFLPKIPGTRVGLRWLEYVLFDDVWRDRDIAVPGILTSCRLLQLGCLDLSTDYYLKFGLRPELPATDDKRRERLKKVDMLMLVAAFLTEYGYPLDYTMHLVVERGTATLYAAEAKAIFDYTGGKVAVCYTEMNGQLVAAWAESRDGNPRGHAAIESFHNLLHNWEGDIAGYIGKDRNHTPAVLDAQRRELVQLNTIARVMTPELRAQFKLPFPSLDEAHAQTLRIVNEINRREDHDCEGFDKVLWWRLQGTKEWQPESELANVPEAVRAYLEYDPRVETPYHRMLRLSDGVSVAEIPGSLLRSFLDDSRAVRKIDRAAFAFTFDGKGYEYLPASPADALPDGTLLTGHFCPMDMSRIHLTDEAGCFVGTWKRFGPFRRGAVEQQEAQRVRGAYLAHAVKNVRRRHAIDIDAQTQRQDDNLAIIAEAGFIPTPTARTLAQVQRHCTPGADRLATALQDAAQDREERAAEKQTRRAASRIPGTIDDLLHGGLSQRSNAGSSDDEPAPIPAPETAQAEDVEIPGPLW